MRAASAIFVPFRISRAICSWYKDRLPVPLRFFLEDRPREPPLDPLLRAPPLDGIVRVFFVLLSVFAFMMDTEKKRSFFVYRMK